MTQNRDAQLAIQGTIESRVRKSGALLERMGITPEAYERVALNALVRNPGLADCDRASLDIAIADCIQAGLLPDGKQAAIVPFKPRNASAAVATVIPMIEGRLMLARRAVPGLALRVRVVYAEDDWDYSDGLRVTLEHRPNPDADKRDKNVIAAYAVAVMPGAAEPEFEVFDRATIDRYQGYSRGGNIWQTHFAEMAKKAVLGQLLKRLPKAVGAPPEPEMPESFVNGIEGLDGVIESEGGVVDTYTGEVQIGVSVQDATDAVVEAGKRVRRSQQKPEPPRDEELPFDDVDMANEAEEEEDAPF